MLIVLDAIMNDYELILLPEIKSSFYSFFIAFIAVNFSFTLVFSFLLNTPKRYLSRYNYKRRNILNQQRVTNWYFLNWFCRIAFMFGLIAFSLESQSLLLKVDAIIYLIIIVFLGQMWMSFRHLLTKNKTKGFLVFISTALLLSFAISKIDVINHKKINASILSNNVIYKHNIQRVSLDAQYQFPNDRSLIVDIYVIDLNNELMVKVGDRLPFRTSEKISEGIQDFKSKFGTAMHPYIVYMLHIDKNIQMDKVKHLKNSLTDEGAKRVYCSIRDDKKPFYFKGNQTFGFILNDNNYEKVPSDYIKIEILGDGNFHFQNDILSKEKLRKSLVKKITIDGVHPFAISFDKNIIFEQYFDLLALTRSIIDHFRDDYSQKGYQEDYNDLPREIKKRIRQKLYWKYIDDYQ